MSRHNLQNPELADYTFLQDIYNDNSFPFEFAQRGEAILVDTCRQIELREEFDIEGGNTLRDAIDNDLAYIAQCYGIYDTDTDRLAATQDDW